MKVIILILTGCLPFTLNAQMVQNKSYDIMLTSLLSHDVKEISAQEAKADLSAVFIDAREKKEYDVSHIKNAIWCGYDDFDYNRVKGVAKNQLIIVYCSVGYRSEKITKKLLIAGYTNVSNMYGGVFEWKNIGYSLVDNLGKETDKVHAYSKTWSIWLNQGEKIYN